jgi:hypothetical protein
MVMFQINLHHFYNGPLKIDKGEFFLTKTGKGQIVDVFESF